MYYSNIEEVTIKNDFLFCTVFTQYPELLKKLIYYITGKRIKKIFGLEKQKIQDFNYLSKGIRLDVTFEGDDEVYHLEMENHNRTNIPKRMRYYQSNSDALQLSKGDSYT